MTRFVYLLIVPLTLCVVSPRARADAPAPERQLTPDDLLYTHYRLACLWTALWGAEENPFFPYLARYHQAIISYSTRKNPQGQRSTTPDDQLTLIHEQSEALLGQYELVPNEGASDAPLAIPAPTSYTAQPLENSASTDRDALLQQLIASLQTLPPIQPQPSALKEQLVLFGVGLALLTGIATIAYIKLSKNLRRLHKETQEMQYELDHPHSPTQRCGIQAQLDCTLEQLRKKAQQ